VAPVVDLLPDLERLNLGFNQLEGMLPCSLPSTSTHRIRELDLASNKARYFLASCLLLSFMESLPLAPSVM
jgi:hypothetical protein